MTRAGRVAASVTQGVDQLPLTPGGPWPHRAVVDLPHTRPVSRPTTRGVAIRVFLADGTPQGLRIVERLGWTGVALAFARADYTSVRGRSEIARTGVYILLGADPQGGRPTRAYVGEGDSVRVRLDQHHRDKDFWTDAIVLTTTDDSLNKAQVRYLESQLLALAREANAAALENSTSPEPTWLSEPDQAVMDSYLDYGLTLLPLLGVEVFEPVEEPLTASPASERAVLQGEGAESETETVHPYLYLRTVATDAQGRDEARGFVVLEGGLARLEENVMLPGYQQLRHRLIAEGVLVPTNETQYRLTRNVVFDSPSAAASVLSGGSKNGRTEWKTADGVTLKELQRRALETTASTVVPAEANSGDA